MQLVYMSSIDDEVFSVDAGNLKQQPCSLADSLVAPKNPSMSITATLWLGHMLPTLPQCRTPGRGGFEDFLAIKESVVEGMRTSHPQYFQRWKPLSDTDQVCSQIS